MGFGNAHQDMDGCTCLERNKKKEVRRRWHSGMLTGTWMDAPGQKEIKKMQAHRPWHSGMLTWAQMNARRERNKQMEVHQPWHSGMLTGTWMDAPGQKEIKKCRSVGDSIQECSLGYGWINLAGKK